LRASPCLRAEAGILEAVGVHVEPSSDALRFWLSLAPVARLRWAALGPLLFEIEGGLVFPITRDRFFVEPVSADFRPPIVGLSAGVGAGVSFW
jgi:hypothetical protein